MEDGGAPVRVPSNIITNSQILFVHNFIVEDMGVKQNKSVLRLNLRVSISQSHSITRQFYLFVYPFEIRAIDHQLVCVVHISHRQKEISIIT